MSIVLPQDAVKLHCGHLSWCLKMSGFYRTILYFRLSSTSTIAQKFNVYVLVQTYQLHFVGKSCKMFRNFLFFVYKWFQNTIPYKCTYYSVDYCFRCCCTADKSTGLLQKQNTWRRITLFVLEYILYIHLQKITRSLLNYQFIKYFGTLILTSFFPK